MSCDFVVFYGQASRIGVETHRGRFERLNQRIQFDQFRIIDGLLKFGQGTLLVGFAVGFALCRWKKNSAQSNEQGEAYNKPEESKSSRKSFAGKLLHSAFSEFEGLEIHGDFQNARLTLSFSLYVHPSRSSHEKSVSQSVYRFWCFYSPG